MKATYSAILTAQGETKLAQAIANQTTLKLTEMAVGDGNGELPTPSREQTSLINEHRRAPLNELSIDPIHTYQLIAEQIIPEEVGGWWIREIGLFDEDGELCAVANCPPTYKSTLDEGAGRTQIIRLVLTVGSTEVVELKIDPSIVLATREYVDLAISRAVVPGTLRFFARPTAPAGYLVCDGQALSRHTYAALFEAIGTCFGEGDGETTFNLPDCRGEFIRGWDNGRGVDSGRAMGSLQSSQNLAHRHDASAAEADGHTHEACTDTQGWHDHAVNDPGHSHTTQAPWGAHGAQQSAVVGPYAIHGYYNTNGAQTGIWLGGNGNHTHQVDIENAGGHSHTVTVNDEGGHEARPRNIAMLICIKY